MMYYTDDPISDFNRWDADQQNNLNKLPVCKCCGEHIQQDMAVCLDDNWYCDECLRDARTVIEVY